MAGTCMGYHMIYKVYIKNIYIASYTMGTGSFPGVKCSRGVMLTTHPLSSAAVMEE